MYQGWIGVDQGGSAVYHGHVLVPGLRKTLKKRGRTANGPTSCGRANLSLIKIKREKQCLSGVQDAGTLNGGVVVAF